MENITILFKITLFIKTCINEISKKKCKFFLMATKKICLSCVIRGVTLPRQWSRLTYQSFLYR